MAENTETQIDALFLLAGITLGAFARDMENKGASPETQAAVWRGIADFAAKRVLALDASITSPAPDRG